MEDMYTYLDYLAATYPWVTVESLGQSFEGQDMRVAKVFTHILWTSHWFMNLWTQGVPGRGWVRSQASHVGGRRHPRPRVDQPCREHLPPPGARGERRGAPGVYTGARLVHE